MKRILEYGHIKARRYFLKEESYFSFDLPKYFVFQPIIEKVSEDFKGKALSNFYGSRIENRKTITTVPSDFEDVNYKFLILTGMPVPLVTL